MKIGFIGVGNMGSAIMRAVLTCTESKNVYIADTNATRVNELSIADKTIASDNCEIALECDYIFLGVKPQMMKDMLTPLSSILKTNKRRQMERYPRAVALLKIQQQAQEPCLSQSVKGRQNNA